MNSTSNYRQWSQSQQRPTFYTTSAFIKNKIKNDEYPPLTAVPEVKLRNEQEGPAASDLRKQGPSLAARLATAIKIDEQNIIMRRVVEKPKPLPQYDILPISQFGRLKYLAERRERAEREAAIIADEHEYRWQMSREISREKFDREYSVEPINLPDDLHEDNNETEDTYTENDHKNKMQ
jgi:hypothetical protein